MADVTKVQPSLIFKLVILAFLGHTTALNFGWKGPDTTSALDFQNQAKSDTSPRSNIRFDLPERLEESRQIIAAFDSLPSCPKVATAALMHSCSVPIKSNENNVGSAPLSTDMVISDAWKAYGAGLAVCELMEAKATIPSECKAFVPTEASTKKRIIAGHILENGASEPATLYPGYEDLTKTNINQCLAALEQRPQSWTSYSNAKQNAVVICRTLQGELQREQSVKTFEKIITSLGFVSEQHDRMGQDYQSQFSELRVTVGRFVEDLDKRWKGIYGHMEQAATEFTREHREQLFEILMAASDFTQESLQKMSETTTDVADRYSAFLDQQQIRASDIAERFEYIQQYTSQYIMQELGKMMQSLNTQHNFVLDNNAAFNELGTHIADVVIRISGAHEQLLATEASARQIREDMMKANETVGDFTENVKYLTRFLDYNWSSLGRRALVFFACLLVFPFLTFGLWERCIGWSFVGNCSAAVGTAMATGLFSSVYFDPSDFLRAHSTDVFQDDLSAQRHVVIGVVFGAAGTICLLGLYVALCRFIAGYRKKSPRIVCDRHIKEGQA